MPMLALLASLTRQHMKEHFTKSTIEAQCWCLKCNRSTMHRVDNGRKGPCLRCLEELEKKHVQLSLIKPAPEEEQLELFQ